jgi:GNAT superfamily N-acetyltransferase
MIKIAKTKEEKENCYEVMKILRPHIKSKEEFLEKVTRMEKTNNYRILMVVQDDIILTLAGIREMETLFQGKIIYIDDLITRDEHRSKGSGKLVMDYIKNYVKEHKLNGLTLDSGVQRFEAHKFYFKNDFHINSYHFNCKL